jgi:5'-nucleotidase
VDGTPTDSIIIGLKKLLQAPPDVVVSGINCGANLGENVYYSGTVGAAMEATIHGIPAIAVSVAYRKPEIDYGPAARLARHLTKLVLEEGLPPGVMLNVNVPQTWTGAVHMTRQSKQVTRCLLKETRDEEGRIYYWLNENVVREGVEPDTDFAAIFEGAVSITPLKLDRTHEISINHLSHWARKLSHMNI